MSPSTIHLAEHRVLFGVGHQLPYLLRTAAGDRDLGSPFQRLLTCGHLDDRESADGLGVRAVDDRPIGRHDAGWPNEIRYRVIPRVPCPRGRRRPPHLCYDYYPRKVRAAGGPAVEGQVAEEFAGGGASMAAQSLVPSTPWVSAQRAVEVIGGADERKVGERLGEVSLLLAGAADLLRVEAEVVGVGEHLLEREPCLF
jgi:hypothetical protein